jgi:FtsP/CotA-like multicopper oxidase with cupredoxin domain
MVRRLGLLAFFASAFFLAASTHAQDRAPRTPAALPVAAKPSTATSASTSQPLEKFPLQQFVSEADVCPRPAIGSEIPEPVDLRSMNGILKIDLTYKNFKDSTGRIRYCYIYGDGVMSPNLRLHPGDTLVLRLKNSLTKFGDDSNNTTTMPGMDMSSSNAKLVKASQSPADPCTSGIMSASSTNLHFHGLTVPANCHEDEALKTSIQPGDAPFEYRFKIPADEQPGLYWYHPHIHGFNKVQALGGASGALIIEGLERANSAAAGLPERIFVIRDEDLLNPNAPPSKSEPVVPKTLIDNDGDAANNGTGFGKPAKDLSINYVSVPYPDYPTGTIHMRPGEKQLWRIVNASAITYLNLAVIFNNHEIQMLDVVALDGVSINANGSGHSATVQRNHIGIPPGGRAEFIVTAPEAGVRALFVCRTVNTGPMGENDPNRALARIVVTPDSPEPQAALAATASPLPAETLPWLGSVQPAVTRHLYFSETPQNPNDPNSPTTFFVTVDGETPKAFDPTSNIPSVVAHQGDVEDWVIENRTKELHAFHIHQLHFLMVEWNGIPVNEPYLRDTINIPFVDNKALQYPSVKLRMDFRDPNTIGTYPFHCHLLEHEDNGMMAIIRVDPPQAPPARSSTASVSPSQRPAASDSASQSTAVATPPSKK